MITRPDGGCRDHAGMISHLKRPVEVRSYEFDFSNFPEIAGGDVLTGSPTLEVTNDPADPPGLTIGPPVIDSEEPTVVVVKISGGADGQVFNLTCKCSTQFGHVLACVGRLKLSSYRDS